MFTRYYSAWLREQSYEGDIGRPDVYITVVLDGCEFTGHLITKEDAVERLAYAHDLKRDGDTFCAKGHHKPQHQDKQRIRAIDGTLVHPDNQWSMVPGVNRVAAFVADASGFLCTDDGIIPFDINKVSTFMVHS